MVSNYYNRGIVRRVYPVIISIVVIILSANYCKHSVRLPNSNPNLVKNKKNTLHPLGSSVHTSPSSDSQHAKPNNKKRKINIVPLHGLFEENTIVGNHYDLIPTIRNKLRASFIEHDVISPKFREGHRSILGSIMHKQGDKLYEFIKGLDGPIFILAYSQSLLVTLIMLQDKWDMLKEKEIYVVGINGPIRGVPLFDLKKKDIEQFFTKLGPVLHSKVNSLSDNLLIQDIIESCHLNSFFPNDMQSKIKITAKCMSFFKKIFGGIRDMLPGSKCTQKAEGFMQDGANGVKMLLIGSGDAEGTKYFPNINDPTDQSTFNAARDALISKGYNCKLNDGLLPLESQVPTGIGNHKNIEIKIFRGLFHAPIDLVTGGELPQEQYDKVVLNNPQVIEYITEWIKKRVQ